jgi:hypothetical protein
MWKEAISLGDCTSNHSPPTHQKPGKIDVVDFLILFTHFVSTETNFYEVKTSLVRLVFETSNLRFIITESKSSCQHLFQKQYLRNCLQQIALWELILDRILRHLRQNKIHCNCFTLVISDIYG